MRIAHLGVIPVGLALVFGLSGCVKNQSADTKNGSGVIEVKITDTTCEVGASTTPSGHTKFKLVNNGTVRNEFEILAEDKLRIVGERENLGPGTTTEYSIDLNEGKYFTACKKNMVGSLVGAAQFTVTKGEEVKVSADEKKLQDQAVTNYTAYVKDQTGRLLEETNKFVKAYLAGNTQEAQKLYPLARMYYERIEPTAEAFGDLDPALDEREADYQEADDKGTREWTGWHRLEKDLWGADAGKLAASDKEKYANKLKEDTQKLFDSVNAADFKLKLDDISNGAIGLLEEVATSKITGEEETFSHTDLYDFQANLEGARVAYGNVEVLAKQKNAKLAQQIDQKMEQLEAALAEYNQAKGDGEWSFVGYDQLDQAKRNDLSDKVNALRKPLAQLTDALLGGGK